VALSPHLLYLTNRLTECCDHDPGNEFKTEYATPLFQSWTAFAKAAGEEPGSAKALKRRLTGKGCEKKDTKQGTMVLGHSTKAQHDGRLRWNMVQTFPYIAHARVGR